MKGTEKQIKWAKGIREETEEEIISFLLTL